MPGVNRRPSQDHAPRAHAGLSGQRTCKVDHCARWSGAESLRPVAGEKGSMLTPLCAAAVAAPGALRRPLPRRLHAGPAAHMLSIIATGCVWCPTVNMGGVPPRAGGEGGGSC